MATMSTCLWFNGNAEEAVNYYLSIFSDGKILSTSRYGEGAPIPAGTIMAIAYTLLGKDFLAINGGPQFQFSGAMSLVVTCETQAEIDDYWAKLSAGGTEFQCGWLNDKFGVTWQIAPKVLPGLLQNPDVAKSQRVMTAMMSMVKFDIAALQAAAIG